MSKLFAPLNHLKFTHLHSVPLVRSGSAGAENRLKIDRAMDGRGYGTFLNNYNNNRFTAGGWGEHKGCERVNILDLDLIKMLHQVVFDSGPILFKQKPISQASTLNLL